jgi:hypothetical protein
LSQGVLESSLPTVVHCILPKALRFSSEGADEVLSIVEEGAGVADVLLNVVDEDVDVGHDCHVEGDEQLEVVELGGSLEHL